MMWPLRVLCRGRIAVLPFSLLLCRQAATSTEVTVSRYRSGQSANVVLKCSILTLELSVVFFDQIDLLREGCQRRL